MQLPDCCAVAIALDKLYIYSQNCSRIQGFLFSPTKTDNHKIMFSFHDFVILIIVKFDKNLGEYKANLR